jgi:hypothetical protein
MPDMAMILPVTIRGSNPKRLDQVRDGWHAMLNAGYWMRLRSKTAPDQMDVANHVGCDLRLLLDGGQEWPPYNVTMRTPTLPKVRVAEAA